MTNARALSIQRYAAGLVKAGINRFYVSIHGHTAKLHESLVRTPEAFEQTVAGIRNVAALKRYGMFHADGGNITFIASNDHFACSGSTVASSASSETRW